MLREPLKSEQCISVPCVPEDKIESASAIASIASFHSNVEVTTITGVNNESAKELHIYIPAPPVKITSCRDTDEISCQEQSLPVHATASPFTIDDTWNPDAPSTKSRTTTEVTEVPSDKHDPQVPPADAATDETALSAVQGRRLRAESYPELNIGDKALILKTGKNKKVNPKTSCLQASTLLTLGIETGYFLFEVAQASIRFCLRPSEPIGVRQGFELSCRPKGFTDFLEHAKSNHRCSRPSCGWPTY